MNELIYRTIGRLLPIMEPGFGMPFGHLQTCLMGIAKRGFTPRSMIDVGANRGKWSSDFNRVFPDCAITMIEPQKELAGRLDRFCAKRRGCRWIQSAVSDEVGEEIFTVSPDTYSSGFWHPEAYAVEHGLERRLVPVTTLDALVRDSGNPPPDVVKIDAEEHELRILSAAESLFGHTQMFFIEANLFGSATGNGFVEIVKFMDSRDYVPYDFSWFYQRPRDKALMLCEIAFVPRTSPLRESLSWA